MSKGNTLGIHPTSLNSVKALSDHVLRTEDGKPKSLFVSMGNPHYVIFVDDVQHMDITTLGKLLEREKAFPQRCNIEFAQLVGEGKASHPCLGTGQRHHHGLRHRCLRHSRSRRKARCLWQTRCHRHGRRRSRHHMESERQPCIYDRTGCLRL